jgi:hypothetical protein
MVSSVLRLMQRKPSLPLDAWQSYPLPTMSCRHRVGEKQRYTRYVSFLSESEN